MLALAGAHRSGKTTLARALAEKLGVEFLETKVSSVFTDLGVSPKADMSFGQRLIVQQAILRSLEIQYTLRAGKPFIADRSPFDVLGYTMADIQRGTLDTTQLRDELLVHVTYAANIVSQSLNGVLLLRPLPNQVDAEGKAQACPYYMHHVYVCIKDMLESITPQLDCEFISAESATHDHAERMTDGVEFYETVNAMFGKEVKIWTPSN